MPIFPDTEPIFRHSFVLRLPRISAPRSRLRPALRQAAGLHSQSLMTTGPRLQPFHRSLLSSFWRTLAVLGFFASSFASAGTSLEDLMNNAMNNSERLQSSQRKEACKTPSTAAQSGVSSTAQFQAQLTQHLTSGAVPDYNDSWGNQCRNFIAGPGKLGDLGVIAANHLTPQETPQLFKGTEDIQKICPNFETWAPDRKVALYVWFLSAVAYPESRCGVAKRPVAGTTEGERSAGLFQLSLNKEPTKGCASRCLIGDSTSERRSTICTVSMLECEAETKNRLFDPSNYWSTTHTGPKGLATCERLAQFPGCSPAACNETLGFHPRKSRKVARR